MKNIKQIIIKKDINEMDKIAIIDLECTCDDTGKIIPRHEMEIIEIGCVIADLNGNTYNEFNCFIKPIIHPTLTPFCTSLTSITQEQVNNGISLEKALSALDDFLFNENVNQWGSWGGFDANQIRKDIRNNKLRETSFPFLKLEHINLSAEYVIKNELQKKVGVRKALGQNKMKFIGIPHRGIDDVRNIARLLPYIFK